MFLELRQWTTSGFPVPTGIATRPFRVPGAGSRNREVSTQRQNAAHGEESGSPPTKSTSRDAQENSNTR